MRRLVGSLRGQRRRNLGQRECSLCGKDQSRVEKLIAGPGACICDECIEPCNEIIVGERSQGRP